MIERTGAAARIALAGAGLILVLAMSTGLVAAALVLAATTKLNGGTRRQRKTA